MEHLLVKSSHIDGHRQGQPGGVPVLSTRRNVIRSHNLFGFICFAFAFVGELRIGPRFMIMQLEKKQAEWSSEGADYTALRLETRRAMEKI